MSEPSSEEQTEQPKPASPQGPSTPKATSPTTYDLNKSINNFTDLSNHIDF